MQLEEKVISSKKIIKSSEKFKIKFITVDTFFYCLPKDKDPREDKSESGMSCVLSAKYACCTIVFSDDIKGRYEKISRMSLLSFTGSICCRVTTIVA